MKFIKKKRVCIDITHEKDNPNVNVLLSLYQALTASRLSHNELFWNVPLTNLTAQAFLYLIALGKDSDPVSVVVASIISIFIGFFSIQLFERNRFMEIMDAEQLESIEKQLRSLGYSLPQTSVKTESRTYLTDDNNFKSSAFVESNLRKKKRISSFSSISSYKLWKTGLWTIVIFSTGILINATLSLYYSASTPAKALNDNDWLFLFLSSFICVIIIVISNMLRQLITNYISIKRFKKSVLIDFLYELPLITHISISLLIIILIIFFIYPQTQDKFILDPINKKIAFVESLIVSIFFSCNAYKWLKELRKTKHTPRKVVNVLLAGGNAKRLQGIIPQHTQKYNLIDYNGKTLLCNAIIRANHISDRIICVTDEEKCSSIIHNYQFNEVLIEPRSTGTLLAISYVMYHYKDILSNGVFIIAPTDHRINDIGEYQKTINSAIDCATKQNAFVLIGVKPQYFCEDFGYITLGKNGTVAEFLEKPQTREEQKPYYNEVDNQRNEYLWNTGIFVTTRNALKSILEKASRDNTIVSRLLMQLASGDEKSIRSLYESLEHPPLQFSFDKNVLQNKEIKEMLRVVKSNMDWIDLGIPATATKEIKIGSLILPKDIENTEVIK